LFYGYGRIILNKKKEKRTSMESAQLNIYKKIIPTYQPLGYERYPVFHTFAGRRCYPYPFCDRISSHKTKISYTMIALENNYLKVEICPDLGGRIYSAFYKPAKQHMFFRNSVVKPGLIGINGAWIMSGVEFNCPAYGHSPVGLMPVSHESGKDEDGAAWVRVGFNDRYFGLRWSVTYTLAPDSSAIDVTYFIHNPTPLEKPFYLWSNAAIKAHPASRLYMPGNFVRDQSFFIYRYPHENGRRFDRFDDYPVDTDCYGLDIKNECFGYYDPHAGFGIVHWSPADHLKGKKFFTWGNKSLNRSWSRRLTDNGHYYYEIQAGRLETQNDFEFIGPYQTFTFNARWYPVNNLGGLTGAGSDTAYFYSNNKMRFLSCREYKGLKLEYRTSRRTGYSTLDLHPGRVRQIENKYKGSDLLEVKLSKGTLNLFKWKKLNAQRKRIKLPYRSSRYFAEPASASEWVKSGIEWELMDNPDQAETCFKKGGSRYPDNLELKLCLCRRWIVRGYHTKTRDYLRKILNRNPENKKACWYMSILYLAGEKDKQASCYLRKLIEDQKYGIPALVELTRTLIRKKQYHEAAELLSSIKYSKNVSIDNIKRYLSRATGKALRCSRSPDISLFQYAEQYASDIIGEEELIAVFGSNLQNYLDIASDYMKLGAWHEGLKIIRASNRINPLIEESYAEAWCYQAYLYLKIKDPGRSCEAMKRGESCRLDFAFPYRPDTLKILKLLCNKYPAASRLFYLLGNLLAGQGRVKEALANWEKSRHLGLKYSVLERNLGWAYHILKRSSPDSASCYNRAVRLDRDSLRLYLERDASLSNVKKFDFAYRYLNKVPGHIRTKGAIRAKKAIHLLRKGNYKKVITLLRNGKYDITEWRLDILEIYLYATLALAIQLNKEGKTEKATRVIYRHYPDIPESFRLEDETPVSNSPAYYILLLLGKKKDWQGRSIGHAIKKAPLYFEVYQDPKCYYTFARCLELTGEKARARKIYLNMESFAKRCTVNYPQLKPWWDVLLGLACKGLGKKGEAGKILRTFIKHSADPHPFIAFELENL
jgi:tetratricopeptide (TPR) repeat protein